MHREKRGGKAQGGSVEGLIFADTLYQLFNLELSCLLRDLLVVDPFEDNAARPIE